MITTEYVARKPDNSRASGAYALENLYHFLGEPAWFWPVIFTLIFIILPLAGSALETIN